MGRYATIVEVTSDSSDSVYRVYIAEDDGPIFCTCPGFRLRRGHVEQRKPCKHMRRLGADREVVEAAKTVARTRRSTPTAKPATGVGRFRFLDVVEESNDGSWTPVVGARFNNLEVN